MTPNNPPAFPRYFHKPTSPFWSLRGPMRFDDATFGTYMTTGKRSSYYTLSNIQGLGWTEIPESEALDLLERNKNESK